MRISEYKAFVELCASKFNVHVPKPTLRDQAIFEGALQFAERHGYTAPRDRCSIHVSVDMRQYNHLFQRMSADAFQLRKCELDAGHTEPCRVIP